MRYLAAAICFTVVCSAPLAAAADQVMCVESGLLLTAELDPLLLEGGARADGGGEVLWCASDDDPRCAPLPTDADPRNVEGRSLLHATAMIGHGDLRAPLANNVTAAVGLAPQSGTASRVERPPRRDRRAHR